MELLKGKPVADAVKEHIRNSVDELISEGVVPTLAILRVGNNESDIAYEESAVKTAKSLGINVEKYIMEEDSKTHDVLDVLEVINENTNIHGILMFRPLPKHIDEEYIRNKIAPNKDIDGISDASVAGLFTGKMTGFPPCTAEAAMLILEKYGIELSGKRAVVIGRSLVIGKPVAMMLMDKNATVTICHSKTPKEALQAICKEADIIVSAAGKINTVDGECVDGKQVIVDVGINFDSAGKMCGDVNFEEVENKVSAITPVPGGVGSVTTALLLYHVCEAAKSQSYED
jgi:methylenetetrahydrofolate dehydrogenase (NADP+)/methenyltetrahydrofolate cyclohydrolase